MYIYIDYYYYFIYTYIYIERERDREKTYICIYKLIINTQPTIFREFSGLLDEISMTVIGFPARAIEPRSKLNLELTQY